MNDDWDLDIEGLERRNKIQLRPYQQAIAPEVFRYMIDNKDLNPCVAIPTGGGKTIIAADIIKHALAEWPDLKIVVVSHVKEILSQDYAALKRYLGLDIGLYSSGLGSRTVNQITVAGIQSAFRQIELFKGTELVIVDEAHLIPLKGTGMYRGFLSGIGEHRCVGLTATPYRLGGGYIYGDTEETIFDDCVIDLTYMEEFNKLVEAGYLCELRTMATTSRLDTNGVRTTAGDFNDKDMAERFDRNEITSAIIREVVDKGQSFKKWLLFAIDIEHAEHITECLISHGINAYVVHSKMKGEIRDKIIEMYRNDNLRAIVNVNILTTGFDVPDVDLIVLLRPTKSPVIHVQSIGRGLRPHPGKDYTMVLDFAGNTERLGPINDIQIRKKRKSSDQQMEPITKTCPSCNCICHPSTRICPNCGTKFEFQSDLRLGSTDAPIIAKKNVGWYNVSETSYKLHTKKYSPNMMRVSYLCGIRTFREMVCVEHEGWAGAKADKWIKNRLTGKIINSWTADYITAEGLIEVANKGGLNEPFRIRVDTTNKYPDIIDYDFTTV